MTRSGFNSITCLKCEVARGGRAAGKNKVGEGSRGSDRNQLINKTTKFIHQLVSKEAFIILERN